MKKTKILVPALAVLALGMAASVTGTVAWYTAEAAAKVNASAASGSITATQSSIDAGTYTVNFTVTPGASPLQLSHVVTAAGTDSVGTSIAVGDLIYGVVANGAVSTRKCSTSSGFITDYSITAVWATTPSDPADVAYLSGKKFTINLGVTGQAKLLSSNGVSSLVNATEATAVVHIAANMALTVNQISVPYVHLEPSNLEGAETNTTGAVAVTAANDITLTADA